VTPVVERVAIVGAGLVGGSVALAARAAGLAEVRVFDADPTVRERAEELGFGSVPGQDLTGTVAGVDLVVVATPAHTVPDVVAEVAGLVAPGTYLTDAASLKADLTLEVESRLRYASTFESTDRSTARSTARPRASWFVGGHPMAGSEHSGPDAADGSLFQGATWVLTPRASTADDTLQAVSGFLRRLGARVLVLAPDRHDELVALVSHLPQLVASTLAEVAGRAVETTGEAVLAVAGGGFRDTTRIAASDPALWLGILRGNRPAVLEALETYRGRLAEVADALEAEDWRRLEGVLARASAARRRLVPKATQDVAVDLVVALDDRPGTLGAATSALGEEGINIEDLAMRHATDATRGALLLRVRRDAAERALTAVRAHGFTAHVEEVDP
jgi:prephenate dehydrogenase